MLKEQGEEEKLDSGSRLIPHDLCLDACDQATRNECRWAYAANVLYSGIACYRLCKLRVHLICDNHDVR
jgi:hypothetical protein